ncbi:uncharacterized protein [Ptychodera flava]|uniref:uncharacterized protein n=1 Tax=Ptychodera flava TaxID=63121 RepID=UPI00396A1512
MEQSQPAVPIYSEGQYQQPSVILQTPNQQNQEEGSSFSHKAAAGIGITQIILGVASIAAGIVAICEECTVSELGTGIWCGVFIIVTGALGCVSAWKKSTGPIVASMVMSIINASAFCSTMLSFSIIAAAVYYQDGDACIAAGSIMAIVAFVSAILAIINSVFCCMGCCCKNKKTQQVIYFTTQEGPMGARNMMYSVQGVQPSGTVFMTPATSQNMYTNNLPTSRQVPTEGGPPPYQTHSGYGTAHTIPGTVPAVQSLPAAPPQGQPVKN